MEKVTTTLNQDRLTIRIAELEREIASMPQGSIGTKTVHGNTYYYHRYMQNGKRKEDYIQPENLNELRSQIEKRKTLAEELKKLKKSLPAQPKKSMKKSETNDSYEFRTLVRLGTGLKNWANPAHGYKKRECYSILSDFVFGKRAERVFVMYGLRRTGKTTMLRQLILDMSPEQLDKTAFIQITTRDNIPAVNHDLRLLEEKGYKYVFIDEVTLMEDFIEGAAIFADIYACLGLKVVLSGTDSLGFAIAAKEQLYDRCVMLHTTFIPYREFENVLGIKGIDEFIRYGGTMSIGGVHYNTESTFATEESADEYVDTAIAHNIQHSLAFYQDGGHFRLLGELYQKGELTSAINRVVEDMNHRFTKDVLTRTFRSSTLSLATNNLLRDCENPIDLTENIDQDSVLVCIKDMLDILEKEEQTVEIDDAHAYQIKEYLKVLDLVAEIDMATLPYVRASEKKIVLTQPGLRYAQTMAIVESLMRDEKFNLLSAKDRNRVIDRVMSTIQGRMLEDQILLETKMACPDKQVLQVQFAIGEFDMVICNPKELTCQIFEIKHSDKTAKEQYRHLIDPEKCAQTEHRYGDIVGKFVIYRGEQTEQEGITYLNAEEYLVQL